MSLRRRNRPGNDPREREIAAFPPAVQPSSTEKEESQRKSEGRERFGKAPPQVVEDVAKAQKTVVFSVKQ